MQGTSDSHEGFEDFRKTRKQRRALYGEPRRPLGKKADILREIEATDAKEIHEQRLSREVHEFFEEATKTAAAIVQKLSARAEEETSGRLANEMEDFLQQTIRRAEAFMVLIKEAEGQEARSELVAKMNNLGAALDQFRIEGTAQVADKHLGQDPMQTDLPGGDTGLSDVTPPARSEQDDPGEPERFDPFGEGAEDAPVAEVADDEGGEPVTLGFHVLDRFEDEAVEADEGGGGEPAPEGDTAETPGGEPPPTEPAPAEQEYSEQEHTEQEYTEQDSTEQGGTGEDEARTEPEAGPGPAAEADSRAGAAPKPAGSGAVDASKMLNERILQDPELLKRSLKALVKSGVLTKDEARDVYRAQLQRYA